LTTFNDLYKVENGPKIYSRLKKRINKWLCTEKESKQSHNIQPLYDNYFEVLMVF